jgi:hypothetical protein
METKEPTTEPQPEKKKRGRKKKMKNTEPKEKKKRGRKKGIPNKNKSKWDGVININSLFRNPVYSKHQAQAKYLKEYNKDLPAIENGRCKVCCRSYVSIYDHIRTKCHQERVKHFEALKDLKQQINVALKMKMA